MRLPLPILVGLSFFPAGMLLCSYFLLAAITVVDRPAPPAAIRIRYIGVGAGVVCVTLMEALQPNPPAAPGTSVSWNLRLSAPDLRGSLWEFEYHSHYVAFPIWCLLLPCLAIPLILWRKHFRKRTAKGFPVHSTTPVEAA